MSKLPFEGIRVADFGWIITAPLGTAWLATMGAEVIKVESKCTPRHPGKREFTEGHTGGRPRHSTAPVALLAELQQVQLLPGHDQAGGAGACLRDYHD